MFLPTSSDRKYINCRSIRATKSARNADQLAILLTSPSAGLNPVVAETHRPFAVRSIDHIRDQDGRTIKAVWLEVYSHAACISSRWCKNVGILLLKGNVLRAQDRAPQGTSDWLNILGGRHVPCNSVGIINCKRNS